VNLPCNFLEADAGVEGLAFFILVERFDFRDLHFVLAEKVQGVLDQLASEALCLMGGIDREIWNPADFTLMIQARRNVTRDLAGIVAGYEDTVGLDLAIDGDRSEFSDLPAGLTPLPELAEDFLHVAVDGNRAESGDGDFVEAREVIGIVGPDGH